MKINKLGEFGLIERIHRLNSSKKGRAAFDNHFLPSSRFQFSSDFVGIGDDAAVIKVSSQKYLLWTTDILIEGVHFPSSYLRNTAFMLGWKALAINLSDIAAMGGVPRYALVTLGLSGNEETKFIDELYRGMNAVGQGFIPAIKIIGGDISKSPVLMINVAVLGEVEKKNLVLRHGAKTGDMICVTGTCGDSAAGLALLRRRHPIPETRYIKFLIRRHLMPTPRVKESRFIARSGFATSMIDNSDGLLASVKFLCKASGVGARIYEDRIPISKQLINVGQTFSLAIKKMALTGGEDYELVFTVRKKCMKSLRARLERKNISITPVGEITRKQAGLKVIKSDGSARLIKKTGFEHF